MHFHAEVWLETNTDVETQIDNIMAPYNEQNEVMKRTEEWTDENGRKRKETYWTNPSGFFDWYQIGGRWTGEHDGYDPDKDRRNWKTCYICNGTGYRNDEIGQKAREKDPTYTCNGCGEYDPQKKAWTHGDTPKGMKIEWPTHFARHEEDIIPVKDITDKLTCYTLVVGKDVFHMEEWTGDKFEATGFDGIVKNKLDELKITDGYLVTVDYHC